jgi:hypothetical protein
MPRRPDSGQINLTEVFHRVQQEMLAQLAVGRLFEHASAAGAATEHHWLELFDRYLPKRYRTSSTNEKPVRRTSKSAQSGRCWPAGTPQPDISP